MKNCPNCRAVIDPYRVKCEYCGTMYFDWATWLQDGEPCFINYSFDNGYVKGVITTKAIPRLETIENKCDSVDVMDWNGCTSKKIVANKSCELRVNFTCVADHKDNSLFKMMIEE